MIWFPGDEVRVVLRGGYPIPGVIKGFTYDVPALLRGGCRDAANVLVTADAGLYGEGDLITVSVADLEAVAMSRIPNMTNGPALTRRTVLKYAQTDPGKDTPDARHDSTRTPDATASRAHPQAEPASRLVPVSVQGDVPPGPSDLGAVRSGGRLRGSRHVARRGVRRRGGDGHQAVSPGSTGVMTSPADQPPPPPERGNVVRLMIAWGLIAAAGVLGVIAAALAGPHVHLGTVPVAVTAGLAGACIGAAVVVLAGKGRQP